MMRVQFFSHFGLRLGEWLSGFVLTSIALLMFCATDMFERSPEYFSGLIAFGSQVAWGIVCTIFGGVRLVALYINGRKRITPYIRMILAFLSCFVYWQLAISLFASGVPGLGWALVPWLLVVEMYNVFRSSVDAREVFDKSRAERNGAEALN
jgi:hypothetical protein